MGVSVRVEGLREVQRALRGLDRDLPKALRLTMNDAVGVLVRDVVSRMSRRSGKAQGSVRARSTQTMARVTEGGRRAPYVPWLDFGGRVGRRQSVIRRVLPEGRYLYNAYFRHRDEFRETLADNLVDVCRRAGLEVSAS